MTHRRHEHKEQFVVIDEFFHEEDGGQHHEPLGHHPDPGKHDYSKGWPRGWWITVVQLICCCPEHECEIMAYAIVFSDGQRGMVFRWNHAPVEKMTESEADFLAGLVEEHKGIEEEDA